MSSLGLPHGLGSAVWIIGEAIGVLNVVGVLDGVLNIGSLFDVFCSRAREGYSQKKFKTETPILIMEFVMKLFPQQTPSIGLY